MPSIQSTLTFSTRALWVLALTSLLGFSVAGVFLGEPAGYAVFGALIAAVLVDVAIMASCFLPPRFLRFARAMWIALAIIVVVARVVVVQLPGMEDNWELLYFASAYAVLTLSFPASLLAGYLILFLPGLIESFALHELIGGGGYGSYVMLDWFLFLVFGYLQWFLILPYAARKLLQFLERRRRVV